MMNDEARQFERRLQTQPVKEVPAGWRAEILEAARSGAAEGRRQNASLDGVSQPGAAALKWLENLFWPHPKAWAGLAVVWVIILVLNHSTRDSAPTSLAKKSEPPSLEMIVELRKQQRMFAELMGSAGSADADRPRDTLNRPRTWRIEVVAV